MTRKRTVRRVWEKINPIKHAIDGAAITPRADLDRLLAREISALDGFTHGYATLTHWQDLANMVNLCETLARDNVGPEALPSVEAAFEALVDSARRFTKTQRMGLTGPGIQAIRDCIEFHDLQRSSIPRSQYERAIKLTADRVRNKHGVIDLGDLTEQTA